MPEASIWKRDSPEPVFMTALYLAMSVSFRLPHLVDMSAFIICSGVCACTEML